MSNRAPDDVTADPASVAGESAPAASASLVTSTPTSTATATATASGLDAPLPLPSIESLTMESDYAPFFQPRVPELLRRAAMKKLFADPHFNLMDGLDTYIDDYSKPDPLPEGMLEQLLHAKDLLDHPSERKVDEPAIAANPSAESGTSSRAAAGSTTKPDTVKAAADVDGSVMPNPDGLQSAREPAAASTVHQDSLATIDSPRWSPGLPHSADPSQSPATRN